MANSFASKEVTYKLTQWRMKFKIVVGSRQLIKHLKYNNSCIQEGDYNLQTIYHFILFLLNDYLQFVLPFPC